MSETKSSFELLTGILSVRLGDIFGFNFEFQIPTSSNSPLLGFNKQKNSLTV